MPADLVQWKLNDLTFTMRREVETKGLRGMWNPKKHPRDRDGKFVPVGTTVMVSGRGPGVVAGVAPRNQVLIHFGDDVEATAVPRGHVRPLTAAEARTLQPATPTVDGPPIELTDAEYEDHISKLGGRLDAALKAGMASDKLNTLNGDGKTYTPERAAEHKQIVDDLMAKYAGVPSEGKALLSGGLGGAGKTTVLGKYAGVKDSDFATINVDDVKEIMAGRGMVPKIEGISPMESAALIHDESGHIANLLAERLYAEKKNVIWDITMASEKSTDKRISDLRDNGYKDVRSVFVDIPVEESVSRALARHRRGLENYRAGKGQGGRYVPPEIIRANKIEGWSSGNRRTFEEMKERFDGWVMFDNSVRGRAPELLDADGWYDNPTEERIAVLEARLRDARFDHSGAPTPQMVDLEKQIALALHDLKTQQQREARRKAQPDDRRRGQVYEDSADDLENLTLAELDELNRRSR